MQPCEPHEGHVAVPVQAGKYTVLTVEFLNAECTLAVVVPHPPIEPELASMVAHELATIHKMIAGWAGVPEGDTKWGVHVVGDNVELYVPPPPGEAPGMVMGLDEHETLRLIEGLAQALSQLRAERKLSKR
jgi:hypothetical protein